MVRGFFVGYFYYVPPMLGGLCCKNKIIQVLSADSPLKQRFVNDYHGYKFHSGNFLSMLFE